VIEQLRLKGVTKNLEKEAEASIDHPMEKKKRRSLSIVL